MSNILTHRELNDLATVRNRLEREENLRIQFSSPSEYNSIKLSSINDLVREYPEQITIRFWHHLGDGFDFKVLNQLPDIRNLWLDPIRAKNWEHFKSLPNLKYLSFGILEIADKKILNRIVHQNLETLILSQMRTKALDLQYLEQAKNLQELRMFGHRKNISSISVLKSLRTLIFSPTIQDSYPYITQLSNLEHLEFHLSYFSWLLEQRDWLAGNSFSLADIAGAANISCLDFLGEIKWRDWPDLKRWYQTVKSRPSVQPLLQDRMAGLRAPRHYADLDF